MGFFFFFFELPVLIRGLPLFDHDVITPTRICCFYQGMDKFSCKTLFARYSNLNLPIRF